MSDSPADLPPQRGLSRRGFLALMGAGGAGAASFGVLTGCSSEATGETDLSYDFYGEHQAGITTPAQDRMHFAAFDIAEDMNRDDVIELLQDWTYAASRLALGLDVAASGAFDGGPYLPPADTGEAADLPASGLTITFGFGRSLFKDASGKDRFSIASKLPAELKPLPKMVNDFIDPAHSEGDICIQACANDPQVAVHAIRNLTRIAFGRAVLRFDFHGAENAA